MKTTRLEDFHRILRETGGYATAAENRRAVRRRPGALVTLRFSLGVAHVFPMCAFYEPLGILNQMSWAGLCFKSVQVAEALGMNVSVEGFGLRQAYSGSVVYLSNHLATLETVLLPSILMAHGPFGFVAKESLSRLPFLKKAAAHMGMVPVGRKSPREDLLHVLAAGSAMIGEGKDFLIFPQGTRDPVFSRRKFSSLGAKLAERAGAAICPIVVDTRCQPRRTKGCLRKVFNDFGPVDTSLDIRVKFGPVIAPGKAREMNERSFDWMASALEAWGMPTERQGE